MAQKLVVGNWKLNNSFHQATQLMEDIMARLVDVPVDVSLGIAPPYVYLNKAVDLTGHSIKLFIAAQNVAPWGNGAFTGEVSAEMLASIGVDYSLVGHSERREYFNETSDQLRVKVDLLLEHDIHPIYCCGESLQTRKHGNYIEFVSQQIEEVLFHLTQDQIQKCVIAYEPVWAIGTGETASPEQAQEVHAAIRDLLRSKYGAETAGQISILYGGSCKPSNAKELFSQEDINGGLIGGASLNADDFIAIAKSF